MYKLDETIDEGMEYGLPKPFAYAAGGFFAALALWSLVAGIASSPTPSSLQVSGTPKEDGFRILHRDDYSDGLLR